MPQRYMTTSETRSGIDIVSLHDAEGAYVEVAPALGNNCFVFHVQEPVFDPVPFEIFRQQPTSYGLPILFPFPNRIRDGVFTFRGQRYTVTPSRHGFVRDKPWQVVSMGASDQKGAWLTSRFEAAQYPAEILQQFPFPFRLDVTYRLRDHALAMETIAQNTGASAMPMGFGIYPYLRRPEAGTLRVPAQKRWELLESLPTGKLLDVAGPYDLRQPQDVTSLVLDDIVTDFMADADGMVRCILDDQRQGVQTIVAFDAAQFPHVVIYTPPAPRQALCIEPYTCPTDGFNLQPQALASNLILQPEEMRDFRVYLSTQMAKE